MTERRLRERGQQHELSNQAPTVCLELSPEPSKWADKNSTRQQIFSAGLKNCWPGFLSSSKPNQAGYTNSTGLELRQTVMEVYPVPLLPLLLTVGFLHTARYRLTLPRSAYSTGLAG